MLSHISDLSTKTEINNNVMGINTESITDDIVKAISKNKEKNNPQIETWKIPMFYIKKNNL